MDARPEPAWAAPGDVDALTPERTMPSKVLFDFTEAPAVQAWTAIDDRVMGGVSRSRLHHDPTGHAIFMGTVSLERNGGFASVRSRPADRGLAGATECLLEVRGDPKTYKLSLLTNDGFDGASHQASFTPAGSVWQTLRLTLNTFRPTWRGRALQGERGLDPAAIRQVGLVFAARQAGAFELHIRRIGLA